MEPTTILMLSVIGLFFFGWRYRAKLKGFDPALLIAVLAIAGTLIYSYRENLGLVKSTVVSVSPSDTSATPVAAVAACISGEDAIDLGNYFKAVAVQLESDPQGEYFKSVEDVRAINKIAGAGGLKSRLQKPDGSPKYPGLADAIDAALVSASGGRDTFLSPDQRAKLVKTLRSLSEALK